MKVVSMSAGTQSRTCAFLSQHTLITNALRVGVGREAAPEANEGYSLRDYAETYGATT